MWLFQRLSEEGASGIIKPKERDRYSCPFNYPLELFFWIGFISFLDPADTVNMAQFRTWNGNLIKKHGLKPKDRSIEWEQEEDT